MMKLELESLIAPEGNECSQEKGVLSPVTPASPLTSLLCFLDERQHSP